MAESKLTQFCGCELTSLKQKFLVTNSQVLSSKIIENYTHFGVESHSIRSLVLRLDELINLTGNSTGQSVLTDEEKQLFGLNLCHRLDKSNYFAKAFELSGLRAKIFECIEELRVAGFDPKEIEPDDITNSHKLKSLAEIFMFYNSYVAERKVRDYPIVLKGVLSSLQKGSLELALSNVELILPLALDLNGMESNFIEELSQKVKTYKAEINANAFLSQTDDKSKNLNEFKSSITAYLNRTPFTSKAKINEGDLSLNLKAALKIEDSLAEVFNWFTSRNANRGNSAIVTPNYDVYAGKIYRFCESRGIPLYLSHGLLACEFSFFAKSMEELQQHFKVATLTLKKTDLLGFVEKFFKTMRAEVPVQDSFKRQVLGFLKNYRLAMSNLKKVENSDQEFWRNLRSFLLELRLSANDLNSDRLGVFFGRPQDLLGCKIPHLAIIGLQDHNYPPKIVPDAILTDEERISINEKITNRKSQHLLKISGPTELQKDVLEKITLGVSSSLMLSFESHDLYQGARSLPSSYLNRVLIAFGEELSIEALYKTVGGIAEDFIPRGDSNNLYYDYEGYLSRSGQTTPSFNAWLKGHEKRKSPDLNDYDGVESKSIGDNCSKIQQSASHAADFFSCPYKYFLKKIVGLPEIQTDLKDTLTWLDAANRGTFIHAVFQGLVNFYKRNTPSAKAWIAYLKSSGEKDAIKLIEEQEKIFESEKLGVPETIISSELAEIKVIVDEFIRREIEYSTQTGFYPILAEEQFSGLKIGGLLFNGFIDRVDTDGKGNYRVLDYKTGKNRFKDNSNLFLDSGQYVHLQHAIYGEWVKANCNPKPKSVNIIAGYYFTSERGEWDRVEARLSDFEEQSLELLKLFENSLTKGLFPKNANNCSGCDYRLVCCGLQLQRKNFVKPQSLLSEIELGLEGEGNK